MARFRNPDPRHRPQGLGAAFRWGVWDRLTGRRRVAAPGLPAPRIPPDTARIEASSSRPRLTWIGHASFLGTLGGRSVLLDPVFSHRIGGFYRRYGEPGLVVADLPRISLILITHGHYDHLDRRSLGRLPAEVPVVVPRGLGAWFRHWSPRPVTELDWWESTHVEGLEITLVPANHWSRRTLFDNNRTLWGGFVVRTAGCAIYHAGDSAWFDGFEEIGRRFPGLDAALLPVGGYAPAWFMERHHLNPEQAGEAFLATGARILVPMHWGAFQLTDEPLREPVERLRAWWDGRGGEPDDLRRLMIPAVGETLFLDEAPGQGSLPTGGDPSR